MKGTILLVDDHPDVLDSLELFLKYKTDRVLKVKKPEHIPTFLENEPIDLVLLDMNFASGTQTGNEGFYWMRKILEFDPDLPVILMTAYGDIDLAVRGIKEGAADFILKPWNNEKLWATIQLALKLRNTRKDLEKIKHHHSQESFHRIHGVPYYTGISPAMKSVYSIVQKVAETDVCVLITGENGTGKEVIAREIHARSKRSSDLFGKVDLGSLSPGLFESELFGHKKGAFTDAREDRTGYFENVNGGTLFLDEIGNLPMSLQAKLLTVLESRKINPVGSSKEIPVNVRIITATNQDPARMVKEGLFREDLLYRINTIHIHLPPLRERTEDILLLAKNFLEEYKKKYNKPALQLDATTSRILSSHNWPGNVRELKHAIERSVILSDGKRIFTEGLIPENKTKSPDLVGKSLEEIEAYYIAESLRKNKFNISDTAKELKIGRQTLYRKMMRNGLQ